MSGDYVTPAATITRDTVTKNDELEELRIENGIVLYCGPSKYHFQRS